MQCISKKSVSMHLSTHAFGYPCVPVHIDSVLDHVDSGAGRGTTCVAERPPHVDHMESLAVWTDQTAAALLVSPRSLVRNR
eukprot:scaffold701179_cov63-Attheya_sp.AAC.1